MELYRQKYREYIDKILQNIDPSDQESVENAFAKLRESNEQMISRNEDWEVTGRAQLMRDALEDAIREQVPAPDEGYADLAVDPLSGHKVSNPTHDISDPIADPSYGMTASATHVDSGSSAASAGHVSVTKTKRPGNFLTGLAVGVGATAAAAIAVVATGLAGPNLGGQSERAALFESEYQEMLPVLDDAVRYLRTVEEEVKRRQVEDPEALTETFGRRFVSIRNLDRGLSDEITESMPRSSDILVRANETAYKVLFTWPVCRIAMLAQPDLVDPVRRGDGLHCSHFGFWNEAGASF